MECDLLIKGGTILDGTSNPGFKGTLAIKVATSTRLFQGQSRGGRPVREIHTPTNMGN